ncbi:MAG: hypothetical protein H7836_14130 [Magnetococcus sp. YQC-3]
MKKLTLCKLKFNEWLTDKELEKRFIFLGNIPNKPGHVAISNIRNGKIDTSYHLDHLEELSDDEI